MSKTTPLQQSDNVVRSVLDHIENLDSPQTALEAQLKESLKNLYDYSKSIEPSKFAARNSVPQLFTDGFSDIQIFEQLKTQIEHISGIAAKKQTEWLQKATEQICLTPASESDLPDDEMLDEDAEFDEDDQDMYGEFDGDEDDEFPSLNREYQLELKSKSKSKSTSQTKQQRTHEADDGFFSHEEMERFANDGELYGKDDYNGEEIDLFSETLWNNDNSDADEEDDDEGFASYADFFGDAKPREFDDQSGEHGEDDEDDEDDENDDLFGLQAFNQGMGEGDFDFNAGEGDEEENDLFATTSKRFRPFDDIDDNDDLQEGMNGSKQQKGGETNAEDEYMKIDDSDAVVDHLISPYEQRTDKLSAQISALERELTGPKRWEMRGEASSYQREQDALVNADVEFDQAMRVAGPITHDVALQFEQIIKARIRDNAFDDVQPRATLTGTISSITTEKKATADAVSSAKPRFGLAEQYEREYQQLATGVDEGSAKLQQQYQDISKMFAIVINQLDALSNYHFTAKAKVNELTITDSASVEQKQEILPSSLNPSLATGGSTISTTISAAPQELHAAKSTGLGVSREEMSVGERQAAIRRRKDQKSQHFQHKSDALTKSAKAGDKGAQKKVEKDQFAKEYDKITKSGQVTVDASMQRGGNKVGPKHNYGSMSGVVDSMNHNNTQMALPRKAKLAKQTGIAASSAKSVMQ